MLEKKQRVFDDFIAAAEYLIRGKFASPGPWDHGRVQRGLLVAR